VGGHYGRLGAINVDAHLDVRKTDPDRHSGTSFRMLIDEGTLDPMRTVELGIQSHANAAAHVEWYRGMGGIIHTLDTVQREGFSESLLTAMRLAGNSGGPYYATLDLDAVRSADAPGVSAPMPVGIAGEDFVAAAHHLGRDPHCVGFDIAELNPTYDVDNKTARLAALATVRFMMGVCRRLAS
jgi:formiminoglutamase